MAWRDVEIFVPCGKGTERNRDEDYGGMRMRLASWNQQKLKKGNL
jgi:hypothetical protein